MNDKKQNYLDEKAETDGMWLLLSVLVFTTALSIPVVS